MKLRSKIAILIVLAVFIALCMLLVVKPLKSGVLGFRDDFNSVLKGSTDDFQPIQLEGWNSALITRPEYDGKDMPDDALVEAINIDLDIKNSLAPRKGSIILGTATTSQNAIKSMNTVNSLYGRELLLRTWGDVIEWWNETADEWEELDDGYTSNQVFTFADLATSTDTEIYSYFSNGKEAIRRFRAGFGTSISQSSSTSITLQADGTYDTAFELGFDNNGKVTVNGIDYTYTDLNGLILQGMSGVPNLSVDKGVIQAVQTTGFTSAPTAAVALIFKDQRIYAAYKSNVYCSRIDKPMDFSFSAPRVGGEGEIINFPLGGDINALADKGDYVAVFKDDFIGSLEFKDYTSDLFDVATIKTVSSGVDVGAVNQKSILQKNNQVLYISNDIGLNSLTTAESADLDFIKSINEKIRPTAELYDFSDATIENLKNKIVLSFRDSVNTTFNNQIILYDILYDRLTEFKNLNASSFAVYNNKLYYGDSLTKNVYQIFYNAYSDNGTAYSTKAKTKWYNFGMPNTWKEIGYLFVEGWITSNTTLKLKINFDEGGTLTSKEVSILGTGSYVTSDAPSGSFGLDPFGIRAFSPVSKNKSDTLKHFAGWVGLSDVDKKFRNIQFEISTTGKDSNYRLMRIVPYIKELDDSYYRDNNENVWINK